MGIAKEFEQKRAVKAPSTTHCPAESNTWKLLSARSLRHCCGLVCPVGPSPLRAARWIHHFPLCGLSLPDGQRLLVPPSTLPLLSSRASSLGLVCPATPHIDTNVYRDAHMPEHKDTCTCTDAQTHTCTQMHTDMHTYTCYSMYTQTHTHTLHTPSFVCCPCCACFL